MTLLHGQIKYCCIVFNQKNYISHKKEDIYFTRYKICIKLIKVQIFRYDIIRKSNTSF